MSSALLGGGLALLLVLFFVGFVVLVVVLVRAGIRQARERREALAGFAAAREWTYREADPSLVDRFHGSPFGTGSGRRATNCLYGRHNGRAMVAFDYHYTTSSGSGDDRRSSSHSYSVVALNLGVQVPALAVSPEGAVGRFFGRLTNRDIQLGSPAFDHAFTVTSDDRRFAADVLHPQMVQLLLQWPALGWRFEGDSMVVINRGTHAPVQVDATLAVMDAVLAHVPEAVWQRLLGRR